MLFEGLFRRGGILSFLWEVGTTVVIDSMCWGGFVGILAVVSAVKYSISRSLLFIFVRLLCTRGLSAGNCKLSDPFSET